ncbi:type II toxin-antitoxin system VapC family toxin [Sphingomonas sp. RT2P30]|uniref:type II toxin-antitoxin system VapC family toxin n=1 Tax=Parasphingomonas halimpatiens TaxID=3096162 RepID=UPI002FCBB666
MKYLFDSNMIIRAVMGIGDPLRRRLAACEEGDIVTSSIAYAEVAYGSVRGRAPSFEKLQAFVEEALVLPFDHKAARAYATLPFRRASYDRLIAAHALSEGLTVVTDNLADFADIPGLKVENWTV